MILNHLGFFLDEALRPAFCRLLEFNEVVIVLKLPEYGSSPSSDEDDSLQKSLSLHHSQYQTDHKIVRKFVGLVQE